MKHLWIKWVWRGSVVVIGFCWSVMLWHQQDLSDRASAAQTASALGSAVSQANDHADQQFKKVQDQVSEVKGSLKTTEDNIAAKLDESTSSLNAGLGRVGKPDPPAPAKLVFTLWDQTFTPEDPVLSKTIQPDGDGAFPVEFTVVNVSESMADTIDIWVDVCSLCSFAKEPKGFEQPAGADDHTRHRLIGSMNPGVSWEKMTVLVKSSVPNPFQVALRYSCKNCGGRIATNQVATITQGTPAKQP